jgi:hypothetical protein
MAKMSDMVVEGQDAKHSFDHWPHHHDHVVSQQWHHLGVN